MGQPYCYWSVATGPYAALMERCAASARRCGIFKEFHVLTDRPIEDCESYDAQTVEMTDGMFKLIYLQAGMSRLLFDYFVWIDADSVFVRNPRNLLDCLGRSPIHVPLTANVSTEAGQTPRLPGERDTGSIESEKPLQPALLKRADGTPALLSEYVDTMTNAGVYNPVYLSGSAFWIVRRDAIDRVVELATHFRAFAKSRGFTANVSACLGYAMQMLCADPEKHRITSRPDLWVSDARHQFRGETPQDTRWLMDDALTRNKWGVYPSIVHLANRRGLEKVANEAERLQKAEEKEYVDK